MSSISYFLALVSLIVLFHTVSSQTISPNNTLFVVSTVTATTTNPLYNNITTPNKLTFAINGTGANGAPTIWLRRGWTYYFDTSAVSSLYPVYITRNSTGNSGTVPSTVVAGPWTTPAVNMYVADAAGTGVVTFYYQSSNNSFLGGPINIVSGVEVSSSSSSSSSTAASSSSRSSTSSPSSTSSLSSTSSPSSTSSWSSTSDNGAFSTLSFNLFVMIGLISIAFIASL